MKTIHSNKGSNFGTNPDHNIWNNNGTYWCHYTVHNNDHTKERVRVSLGTKDVAIARALRDFLMDAPPKIAARIPKTRGQAMPDVGPNFSESRASPSLIDPRVEPCEVTHKQFSRANAAC